MLYLNKNKTLKPVIKQALKVAAPIVENSDMGSCIDGFSEVSQEINSVSPMNKS